MDWITGIQRALDYVEEHITGPIDYEEAARRACSSSFHFQRVFSVLCGFTPVSYTHLMDRYDQKADRKYLPEYYRKIGIAHREEGGKHFFLIIMLR